MDREFCTSMIPVWLDLTPTDFVFYGEEPSLPFEISDISIGPEELSDTASGLVVRYWAIYVDINGKDLYLYDIEKDESTLLIVDSTLITEVRLTFDQNASPVVVYITTFRELKIRRLDAQVGGYVIEVLASNVRSSLIQMDLYNQSFSDISDILVHYIVNGAIFTRVQRDNYSIEYATPVTEGATVLFQSGKSVGNRFQVEFLIGDLEVWIEVCKGQVSWSALPTLDCNWTDINRTEESWGKLNTICQSWDIVPASESSWVKIPSGETGIKRCN